MLDEIKKFAETVKAVLLWIVAPILFIGALIYSSMGKPKDRSAEKELIESLEKKAALSGQEADKSAEEYRRMRNSYDGGDGSSGPSNT